MVQLCIPEANLCEKLNLQKFWRKILNLGMLFISNIHSIYKFQISTLYIILKYWDLILTIEGKINITPIRNSMLDPLAFYTY